MGEPAQRVATYSDVEDAPEGMIAEILGGELHLSPRPASPHVEVYGNAYGDLRAQFGRRRGGDGPGGWLLHPEPELHLGVPRSRDVVLVPDIAGWRRERLAGKLPTNDVVPDWVCEILSPGSVNVRRDRILKPDIYASRGIAHLWILDPEAQTLEVHRLQGGVYARVQAFIGDMQIRAEPFDAVELDLGAWWPPTDPG